MTRRRIRGTVALVLGVLAVLGAAWPVQVAWLLALAAVPAWAVLNVYGLARWGSWLVDRDLEGTWPAHLPVAVAVGTGAPWALAAMVAVPGWFALVAHLVGAP